jgi:chlorite dismutase/heme-degrading monooxygenase HmoA
MERREPPITEEGWYALHDFRSVDWDAWRDAPERDREQAIAEGRSHLAAALDLEDAEEGASAVYEIFGHKADLMVVHLRPTFEDVGVLERRFERTALAEFTERETSFVSVTEASGYSERAEQFFEGELDESSGLARYIRSRLEPDLPERDHVCFYPMSKRRQPEQNWYDLPFDERREHMDVHGEIGRDYGGKVTQMITGAIGFDDWEWGVTLWADDPVDVKHLLYEMRFDQSTSKYADFGPFYFGRRIEPSDLRPLLAGEAVPAGDEGHPHGGAHDEAAHGDAHGEAAHGTDEAPNHPADAVADDHDDSAATPELAADLADLGVDLPADLPAEAHGLLFHSEAAQDEVADEVDGMRGNFEHYDSHVLTEVVGVEDGDATCAIVSVWANEGAADTAAGFLADMPDVTTQRDGPVGSAGGAGGAGDAEAHADDAHAPAGSDDEDAGAEDLRAELEDMGVYAGKPHGEDVYAMVLYSTADAETLFEEVDGMRDRFDHYDTHVKTAVYQPSELHPDADENAVVSIWDTADAADKAGGFLADLPGVTRQAGDTDDGNWGTMGMFYQIKPEHRGDFVDKFGTVGEVLGDMDGHRTTTLFVNREDENDTFIASRWDSKEHAMDFFRSDAFSDTVDWGRDVLADRPRHVFLA